MPPIAKDGGDQSSSSKLTLLSRRGHTHAEKVTPFWDTFDRIIGNAFCHVSNRQGVVNMAISNNYLLERELLHFFRSSLQMQPADLTYGTSLYGSVRLFDALCKHFNSLTFSPVKPVLPEHLITGPGCGALLDQLAEHLADPGDAFFVSAPTYNAYSDDLSCRAGVECVHVSSTHDDGTGESNFRGEGALRGFHHALSDWQAKHTKEKARAILICNPHNPVGRCYDRNALIAFGRFAEKTDLHLVFDEIFALSTYKPTIHDGLLAEPFHSALSIDWQTEANCHPSRIHVVWSASKDFGINGLRVGTIISQANKTLIRAMKATAKLYMISSPADALFCALINNDAVYADFISTNHSRAAQAYETAIKWCKFQQIQYTPAYVGHFILVDLSRFLPNEVDGKLLENSAAREGALWAHLLKHAVCLTPGSNYHLNRLGAFRLTFTLRKPALLEGLSRLEQALGLPPWPERTAIEKEPEPTMKSIALEPEEAISAGQTPRQWLSASSTQAQQERLVYIDAVNDVLKQGGGATALAGCGMACPGC